MCAWIRPAPLVCSVLGLAACAGRSTLAPIAPERASAELQLARAAFSAQPQSDRLRLRYGIAEYRVRNDSGVRTTLEPLLDQSGEVGAQANLVYGAAAHRQRDIPTARVAYLRYLSIVGKDADVEARLGDLARTEAELAAKESIQREQALVPALYPAKTVGVAPLRVDPADTSIAPLAYGLADLLINDLSESKQIEIVDRVRIAALLRELELSGSGRVDSAAAPRLGKLVGARRFVNGAITRMPSGKLSVTARVADVAQGTVVGQPVSQQTSLAEILEAEKQLAFGLFDALSVSLSPAERAAVERRPTRYLSAFLAYARGSRDEAQGHLEAAEDYYAAAVSIDPGFRLAAERLASVRSNSGRPRVSQRLLAPDRWNLDLLSGVFQGINPSPADHIGDIRDHDDSGPRTVLGAGAYGTIIIIIGKP